MLCLLIFAATLSACSAGGALRHNQSSGNEGRPGEKAKLLQENAEKANQLVLPFIANKGQFDPAIKFYAQTFTGRVLVTNNEVIYELPKAGAASESRSGIVLKEVFSSPNSPNILPKAGEKSDTVVNFFLGDNKSKWISGAETYKSVGLGDPWRGVKLELIAHGNTVEKLFTVAPREDPSAILMSFEGMHNLSVDPSTDALVVSTDLGDVRFSKPIAYQIHDGTQVAIDVAYRLHGNSYGFSLGEYDRSKELIIDPFLASTYYGGAAANYLFNMAQDSSQNIYVIGYTADATALPLGGGYNHTISGSNDILVARFLPDFSGILSTTFIGGSSSDTGGSVAIDESGNVYISGTSSSSNYPTTSGAYCESFTGSAIVVSKFNSTLSSLLASTCLASNGSVMTEDIMLDGSTDVVVMGSTNGSNFPTTTGAYDEVANGGWDVVIAKLNSSLTTLLASTYIGGSANDFSTEIARDSAGNYYLIGFTASSDFPVTGSGYDVSYNGGNDGFISKFTPTLSTLSRSTFLGGSSNDVPISVSINSANQPYALLNTSSSDFPTTTGAYDESHNGGSDAAIARLDTNLSSLLSATFIGSASDETPASIALDYSGNVYIGGRTNGSGYPTTAGAYDTTFNTGDGAISKFDSGLTTLLASTFFGGTLSEDPAAIILDNRGHFYITGYTLSADYPTTSGVFLDFDLSAAFINNGFVTKGYTTLSTTPPTLNVLNVTSATTNGTYSTGSTISIQVVFDQIVTVTGTPQLTLETGASDAVVNYDSGSGTNILNFTYTVASGHASSDLDYVSTSALGLNAGTIKDSEGGDAILTLPSPGAAGSLGSNKSLVLDTVTTAPMLSSPATGAVGRHVVITYSLPETPSAGSVRVSFINGSSAVVANLTLNNATSNSFTEDIKSIGTDNPSIVLSSTASSVPDGAYTVTLTYQDAAGNAAASTSVSGVTIDTSSPAVTISSSAANPTRTSPIPVSFTFSKSVTGFVVGDITVTNGSAGNFSGSGTTYSADITPATDGLVLVNVGSSVAEDGLGNSNSAATQLSRTYDTTTDSPMLTTPLTGTGGATFLVSYTLPEAPQSGSVELSFINASSTVVATATLTNSTSASFSLDPKNINLASGVVSTTANSIADGVYSIRLRYQDALGNPLASTTASSITVDTVLPTVVISTSASSPTNTSPIPLTITFSEPVSGFVVGDITVSQATLSNFSGSGDTYAVSATPSASGSEVAIDIASGTAQDAVGNSNNAASQFSITYDNETLAPLFISPESGTSSNPLPIEYTLQESPLTGSVQLQFVDASSSTVAVAVLSNTTSATFDLNPKQIHLSSGVVSTNANSVADGVYSLILRYQDALGNPPATETITNVTVDSVNPSVEISSSTSDPTSVSPIPITITFSKPVFDFTINDISSANTRLENFYAEGEGASSATFTVDAIPSEAASTISIDIAAGVAVDASSNPNTEAVQFTRAIDGTAPSVSISSSATSPTALSPIPIRITFSESVAGFVVGDISADNAQVTNFAGSGGSYTADVTPTANGIVTVTIASSVAEDLAGNANSAAAPFSIQYLLQPGVPTIRTSPGFKSLPLSKVFGTSQPNTRIEVFSGSLSVGTTTSDESGNWSVTLDPVLVGGTFSLTAAAGEQGAQSESSAPVVFLIPAMPHDFDKDGVSDVVMFSSKEKSGVLKVVSSGVSKDYKIKKPFIVPALGDYDGDGAADIAVLSKGKKNFDWFFVNRESSVITKEQFGTITSVILIGCNFDSSLETEMASFARSTLFVKRKGGPKSKFKLSKIYSDKSLRGCGDVDGDGVAELIFNTSRTRKVGKKKVTSLDLDIVKITGSLYKTISQTGKFHFAFVGDVAGDETADISIQSNPSKPIFSVYEGDTDQIMGQFDVKVASSYSFGVSQDVDSRTFFSSVHYGKSKSLVTTKIIKNGASSSSSLRVTGKLANSNYLHVAE